MPLGFSIIGSTVTFSSGERPRALLLLHYTVTVLAINVYTKYRYRALAKISSCLFKEYQNLRGNDKTEL